MSETGILDSILVLGHRRQSTLSHRMAQTYCPGFCCHISFNKETTIKKPFRFIHMEKNYYSAHDILFPY